MNTRHDFSKLDAAIDAALDALPGSACKETKPTVRHHCHEVVLALVKAKQRVHQLRSLYEKYPLHER